MKVVITGDDGFIGSHLKFRLKLKGHSVVGIDKKRPNLDIQWAQALVFEPNVVVHLAANLFDNFHENLETTKKVSEMFNCHVIFTSSAAVYGNGESNEESELNPINDYGYFKSKEEECIRGIPFHTIFRLGNVYGVGSDHGIIAKITSGECPPINGDGEQTRDFIAVEAVCKAIIQAAEEGTTGTYNLATGVGTTINHLYNHFNRDKCYVKGVDEIRHSVLPMDKFERIFGWTPYPLL